MEESMKSSKFLISATVAATLAISAIPAQAEGSSDGYGQSPVGKLEHGLANMATGWVELPKNIINISSDSNVLVGVTWGSLRGALETVSRTLGGVADFLTFPFATSDFVSPGYAGERFSEDSRYFGVAWPGHWTTFGPLDDGEKLRLE
jgi:putative exosortase-associated protein (TIGR04073 family)